MAAEPELLYIDSIVTQSIGAQRKIVVLVVSWFYKVEHNLKIWFNNTGRDCDGRMVSLSSDEINSVARLWRARTYGINSTVVQGVPQRSELVR